MLLVEAMRHKRPVVCWSSGKRREFCPTILGHSAGNEVLLAFQFAGESSSKLPPSGEWRCFKVRNLERLELRDGPWIVGSDHRASQTCIQDVDWDVNPDSPYNPRRRF